MSWTDDLKSNGVQMTCSATDVLYYQGMADNLLYLLLNGSVELYLERGDSRKLAHVVKPGNFFGVECIADGGVSLFTAIAASHCSVLRIEATKLNNIFNTSPSLCLQLLNSLSTSLRAIHKLYAEIKEAEAVVEQEEPINRYSAPSSSPHSKTLMELEEELNQAALSAQASLILSAQNPEVQSFVDSLISGQTYMPQQTMSAPSPFYPVQQPPMQMQPHAYQMPQSMPIQQQYAPEPTHQPAPFSAKAAPPIPSKSAQKPIEKKPQDKKPETKIPAEVSKVTTAQAITKDERKVLELELQSLGDAANQQSAPKPFTGEIVLPTSFNQYLSEHPKFGITAPPDAVTYVFSKKYTCPCCSLEFSDDATLAYKLKVKEIMPDMRTRYEFCDPLWYFIRICPACNIAAMANSFAKIGPRERKVLQAADYKITVPKFSGWKIPRQIDTVFESYYLALECLGRTTKEPLNEAQIWRRLMWLYGDVDNKILHDLARQKTLDKYVDVYQTMTLGGEEEIQLNVILGDLFNAVHDKSNAYKHYFNVISKEEMAGGANIKHCRDAIADLRS